MATRRRIAVLTASRAEYGLLSHVMREIGRHDDLALQTIVTGTHLSSAFGDTAKQIEADGFSIDARVDMELRGDDSASLARSAGLCTAGVGEALRRLETEMIVLLGDRYETLAAGLAATISRVPIAHIAGGDVTRGAFDDAIRDAISKLSQLHFATCEESAERLRRMDEPSDRVHVAGSLSTDAVLAMRRHSRGELESHLGWRMRSRNVAAAFHPATLSERPEEELKEFLAGLALLGNEVGIVLNSSNADPMGMRFNAMIGAWSNGRENVRMVTSMDHERWLSVMSVVDAVAGNSSSGIYEAPILKRPTVNAGMRQAGRVRARSVVDVGAQREEIAGAILRAFTMDCSGVVSPYGETAAAPKIVERIRSTANWKGLLGTGARVKALRYL